MSEQITVFTIPERWVWDSSVREDTPYYKIVGLLTPEQNELWLPENPKEYMYGGGYHQGYSRYDVAETDIILEPRQQQVLTSFVSRHLLKKQWYDVGLNQEAYDCHWFASAMVGKMAMKEDTDTSLTIAQQIIQDGKREDLIEQGKMGVIGSRINDEVWAEHSYIGLPDERSLQVMGMHGPLAIAPQAETIQHYREMSGLFSHTHLHLAAR